MVTRPAYLAPVELMSIAARIRRPLCFCTATSSSPSSPSDFCEELTNSSSSCSAGAGLSSAAISSASAVLRGMRDARLPTVTADRGIARSDASAQADRVDGSRRKFGERVNYKRSDLSKA